MQLAEGSGHIDKALKGALCLANWNLANSYLFQHIAAF